MGSEWKTVQLSELSTKITKGTTPTKKDGGFASEGINFVKAECVTLQGTIDTSKFTFVSEQIHQKYARSHLEEGDVLFSMAGVILGKTAIVERAHLPANTNQALALIRPDQQQIEPRYLHYFLQNPSVFHYVNNSTSQSAQPNINLKEIGDLEIALPPLSEQKAIAHVLGTLDDKIELNRRMNATLEGMAQALFKSWFVDFDPVIDNALAAGNPIPDELAPRAEVRKKTLANGTTTTQQGSLDHPTLSDPKSLFPAAFELNDELGWIPEGWEVRPLDKIAHYQNGLALQKFRPKDGETAMPVVKIAQLKTGEPTWDETASPSIKPECILNDGDVVFSWSGSLMVTLWCGGQAALNQHLFKVTSQDYPRWFFLEWTKKHLADFQRIAADKAVTMGHIKRSHLSEAMCLVPSATLIQEGSRIIPPIIDRLISNELESRTLTKLRDTLLPKLISGELRISETEPLTKKALNV